jgi:transposase
LKEVSRSGRPSRLNPEQARALRRFIVKPRVGSDKVTGPMVARYLKEKLGVTLTVRQCWRILKRML